MAIPTCIRLWKMRERKFLVIWKSPVPSRPAFLGASFMFQGPVTQRKPWVLCRKGYNMNWWICGSLQICQAPPPWNHMALIENGWSRSPKCLAFITGNTHFSLFSYFSNTIARVSCSFLIPWICSESYCTEDSILFKQGSDNSPLFKWVI